MKHIVKDIRRGFAREGLCYTHNGLAVFSKSGFDKHGSKSKPEGAVGVADAELPAWSAALKRNNHT